jgi:DNA-binding transcriptional ArsR family regulator
MTASIATGRVSTLPEPTATRIADYLRAIGQTTRLRLIGHLGEGSATAADLADKLGQSHANITRHLQALYSLGLADRDLCRGRFVYSLGDRTSLELLDQIAERLSERDRENGAGP